MRQKNAIGVCDLGASGGKIFAAYSTGEALELREVYRFSNNPLNYTQKSKSGDTIIRSYWNFNGIWREVLNGISAIAGLSDVNVVSFGIDTWGSDGTWIDASGDRLGMIGTGRDARWQLSRQEILNTISAQELFKVTGVQSYPFNVINQLYWFAKYNPELVSIVETYMPFHSLLYYYLTGIRIAEYTWMSTTQLCAARRQEYSEKIFNLLGLPLDKMPKIVSSSISLGQCHADIANEINTMSFEVLVPAVHDTACAYAAAPIKPGCNSLIVSSGTWALAGVNLSEPILNQSAFDAGFSNEAGIDGETRFLRNVMGTWPAQQLRQLWSRQDKKELSWDDFDKIALAGYPGKCVIDIDNPMFYDSSNMELTIYQYCKAAGQKQPTNRSELACAVYQSLALKISLVAEDISILIGKPIEEILLLGGATRSSVLCQWIADAAGLYLRIGPAEATAFGNAILQAKALGWIKTIKEGRELIGMSYRDKVFSAKNSEFWREVKSTFREQIQNT